MKIIGVLGGYGDVGLKVLELLNKKDDICLLGAGRNLNKVSLKIKEKLENVKWYKVDINEEEEVLEFIKKLDVVVNCVGPSSVYSSKIAQLCIDNQCKYVDVGYDSGIKNIKVDDKSVCIYASGSSPGISGILCRYLAKQFKEILSMTYITSANGIFTYNAAWDYLYGVTDKSNLSRASWINGNIEENTLLRQQNRKLPFIDEEVDMFPYFDEESEIVAQKINPKEAKWYIALGGKHIKAAIDRSCILFNVDKDKAIRELVQASKLDAMKKKYYVIYFVEIYGVDLDGNESVKTLVLKCNNPTELTGGVAGITANIVANNDNLIGNYPLSYLDEYECIIEDLKMIDSIEQLYIYESNIDSLMLTQEGEI